MELQRKHTEGAYDHCILDVYRHNNMRIGSHFLAKTVQKSVGAFNRTYEAISFRRFIRCRGVLKIILMFSKPCAKP